MSKPKRRLKKSSIEYWTELLQVVYHEAPSVKSASKIMRFVDRFERSIRSEAKRGL